MEGIRTTFHKLFDGKGYKGNSFKVCKERKELAKIYGLYHSIQSAADYDFTKIRKIYKEPLISFFEYLIYMGDKAIADEAQFKYDEKLRKAKIK